MHDLKRLGSAHRIRVPLVGARRWLFCGLVAGTTLIGAFMMLDIVRDSGVTALEIMILGLFAVTFCWISIPFWSAVIGFILGVLGRDPLSLKRIPVAATVDAPVTSRTALVMPIHNEDPARVMAGLAAVQRSVVVTGSGDLFDIHLLSDTTDPVIARAEEEAWVALRREPGSVGLYYRRRAANVGRKAGNIADFCQEWGAHYDFMIVLDADSVMSGSAVVELVRTMEANPRAGLIQTVPIPARRISLFGRLVQFAGCLYSPMLASGQSFWQTDAANYWGHNAIIRVGAFVDHCSLPVLPGRPPMGGAILSHDFVEAALMRRAGWQVYLIPSIGGSYEEVPNNILDYAKRDRRWTQGSLQHLRLLPGGGFHFVNRLHFVLGAMGYVSSLLWLLMLLASTAYVVMPQPSGALSIGDGHLPLPGWPVAWTNTTVAGITSLLGVTVAILFTPKLLALCLTVVRDRRRFGGAGRLLLSALVEMLFAVVTASLMMMYHTRFVISVLCGHDIRWDAQARDSRPVAWAEAWRRTAWITTAGLMWAGLTLYFSPAFCLWLSPIFAGLLLAAPLVRWTSSWSLGQRARRLGLFLVPSETTLPPELSSASRSAEAAPARETAPGLAASSAQLLEQIPAGSRRMLHRGRGAARADAPV